MDDNIFTVTIDDVTYTIDMLKLLYEFGLALFTLVAMLITIVVLGIICYRQRRALNRLYGEASEEEAPLFSMLGNENYTITGLNYGDRRIPDIEVRSRALYIDGNFKRTLARNSRLYNRGPGVFVDGKFVG